MIVYKEKFFTVLDSCLWAGDSIPYALSDSSQTIPLSVLNCLRSSSPLLYVYYSLSILMASESMPDIRQMHFIHQVGQISNYKEVDIGLELSVNSRELKIEKLFASDEPDNPYMITIDAPVRDVLSKWVLVELF